MPPEGYEMQAASSSVSSIGTAAAAAALLECSRASLAWQLSHSVRPFCCVSSLLLLNAITHGALQ